MVFHELQPAPRESGQLEASAAPPILLRYYRHALRRHGWRILPASGAESEAGAGPGCELAARRGPYAYAIALEADQSATHLVIRVGRAWAG